MILEIKVSQGVKNSSHPKVFVETLSISVVCTWEKYGFLLIFSCIYFFRCCMQGYFFFFFWFLNLTNFYFLTPYVS